MELPWTRVGRCALTDPKWECALGIWWCHANPTGSSQTRALLQDLILQFSLELQQQLTTNLHHRLINMKCFAVLAAAATLVAQTIAYSSDICPPSEINKLIGLAAEPSLVPCQDTTGFTFLPPAGYPTDDQIFLMCATDDCRTTFAALAALGPSDCVTEFGGVSLNVLNITESFKPACHELGFDW